MSWFSTTFSVDALKKEYRALARKYHPDVSTDPEAEEKFKEIAAEYTRRIKGSIHYVVPNFDEFGAQQKIAKAMTAIKDILDELYPRTYIDYVAWVFWGCLEFKQTPVQKVCHTLTIAHEFLPCDAVYATFIPKTRKKVAEVWYDATSLTYFIDGKPADFETSLPATQIRNGSRYKVYQSGKWQKLYDEATGLTYYLKRSPKLDVEELFGI